MSCCFAAHRQLRRYVTDDCFRSLVVSLVHSRLDYGNFALSWSGFQHIYSGAWCFDYDDVSDALATLHWLLLPQRVDFKVAVMAFRVLHGLSPPYLNDFVVLPTCLVVADFARHHYINC